MRVRLRLLGYTCLSVTFDAGPAPEEEEYPIVDAHEGEHIIFTPESC